MECDSETFEKQVTDYIDGFKLDPNKRVWPERCMRLGKSIFRKRSVHSEFDAGAGGFVWED